MLHLGAIMGWIAYWAVRQSPYNAPTDLNFVLLRFKNSVRQKFDANEFLEMEGIELEIMLRENLFSQPAVRQWNDRKNKKNRHAGSFLSAVGLPKPDDDFIDLDALVRNIRMSVIDEFICEYERFDKAESRKLNVFRRIWKKLRRQ